MKRRALVIAPLALLLLAAAPGGRLTTLPLGEYRCSLPGDAAGPAWIDVPEERFTIVNASSYETERGRGTYLMLGARVTFTSGPMRGEEFELRSSSMLRKLRRDDRPHPLRCVRIAGAR